jgi:hypothetical protein
MISRTRLVLKQMAALAVALLAGIELFQHAMEAVSKLCGSWRIRQWVLTA